MCRPAFCLLFVGLIVTAAAQAPLKSVSTYAKKYGETQNAVQVDPARDLPSYPAVEPKEALNTWQLRGGFKLQLAANEPQVRDPIAISFDERGRMFVCEMIDYSEMRDEQPHWGRISMLEDLDGDGLYEKSTVFADNLPWPTGLIWANGGLFVGATPDIWRLEDKDGDGRAEVRKRVFTGFGTGLSLLNVQGLLNSFQWGQDNRVHVLAGGGNRGVITCLERPELKGVELGGRDFWFDPVTLDFGLEAGGAQYGMSFDDYGRKFGCSNSDHLQHWIYDDYFAGKNPFFQMPPARRSIAADGGAAEVFRISPDEPWRIIRTRWRIAGVVKGAVEGGGRVSGYFTGATGTTIYRGDAYGTEFKNNSFTGDAGGQLIHRKVIRPSEDGISLIGERPVDERGFEFAASKDTWVRVVNFANAPDGCMHVCDMYRQVIEHPWSIPDEIKLHLDLNRGNDRGRIYRIVPDAGVERIGQRVNLADMSTPELVKTLGHSNGWHRDTAQRLLYERQDKGAMNALEEVVRTSSNPLATLHALGALEGMKALSEPLVIAALQNKEDTVVERGLVLAARHLKLSPPSDELWQAMVKLNTNERPARVKFQLALTLGQTSHPDLSKVLASIGPKSELMAAAVLNAPPELAAELLNNLPPSKGNRQPNREFLVPQLYRIIGWRNDPAEVAATIKELAVNAMPEHIAAFAEGLAKAGSSIDKADGEKRLASVFIKAAETATDRAAPEVERLRAIALLRLASSSDASDALTRCLYEGQPDAVQAAAVEAKQRSASKQVTEVLLSHWPDYGPKAKAAAVEAFLSRDERVLALLNSQQVNPKDFSASQVQALVKHKNPEIVAAAKTALASVIPPSREEVLAKFKPALELQGSAEAGMTHFMARCMACHVAKEQGIVVGPDLITVKTKGKEALLSAILEPHKEVASQYIAYTVSTKEGQTLMGIITDDTASSMTIKMMGGAEITLQRSQIAGSSSNGQSLMPEGLEQGMTPQEMADLIAFIEAL